MKNMRYVIFGTDELSRQAALFLGLENVDCFFSADAEEKDLLSRPIRTTDEELLQCSADSMIVIGWRDVKMISLAVEKLYSLGISYKLFGEAASEIIENEAKEYERLNKRPECSYDPSRKKFYARDRVAQAGSVNHYFWQDLWAAKHIFENKPELHYDIGSRVDGSIADLLSFGQKVNLIDVRPLDVQIPGVSFTQADATELKEIEDGAISSLSALCSLEHFGLGRYGDPIDPEACFKCFEAIQRKVAPGGNIYIAVPVGREGVEFNAHRVFYAETIVREFSKCQLVEFSIDRGTHIEYDAPLHILDDAKDYEFGLFYFRR